MSSELRHLFLKVFMIGTLTLFLTGAATSLHAATETTLSREFSLMMAVLGTVLILFCSFCILVTLRSKKTERSLQQIRDDLLLALAEAPAALWHWDIKAGKITAHEMAEILPASSPKNPIVEDFEIWNQRRIHPDDLERVLTSLHKYMEGETPTFRCEHRLKKQNGGWKWVISSGRITSRDRAGNPLHLSGIQMDITELRQSQEELRENQTLLQAFMRFFPGSAFIKDQDSRIVYTNSGLAKDGWEDKKPHFDESASNPEISKALSIFDKKALDEGSIDFIIDLPDDNDIPRTFHVFKFRIDRDDKPPLIGNLTLDINEQKRQEDAFRSLLNALPDPALLVGKDEIVLTANLSACRELGHPLEDVMGKSYFELLPPSCAPHAREYVESMKRTLKNVSFEEERDGSHFRHSFFPVLNSMENYCGFAVVAFNITRIKQAERNFRTSETQLRTVIDTVPHRISTQDASGRFVLVNRAAASLYGLSPNDMKGLSPDDLLPSDSPNRGIAPEDINVILTGQPRVISKEKVVDRRGETLIQKTIKMPILLSESGEKGLLAVSVDITDLARAEDQIRKFNEELEEKVRQRTGELETANRELSTFAYTVSHDLRAPLRAMEGFAQILIDEKGTMLDQEGNRFLERITGGARKMNLLIEGLLEFSRGSRREMVQFSVPLSEMACEIADDLTASAPERVALWDIQPDLRTFGDQQLLKIVLENLLGNAWKFTSKRESAKIQFGMTHTGRGPTFFVKDNGPGFEPDQAGVIFDVFQKLHPESVFEGSGIGLATVRRILERHGGQIWAHPEEGKGATFFFTVPAEKPTEESFQHPNGQDGQKVEETSADRQRRSRP